MTYSLRSLFVVVTLVSIACGWWSNRRYCLEQAKVQEWKEMEGLIVGTIVATSSWSTNDDYERELADPKRVAAREQAKLHGQLKETYRRAVWQPWQRLWIDDNPLPGEATP